MVTNLVVTSSFVSRYVIHNKELRNFDFPLEIIPITMIPLLSSIFCSSVFEIIILNENKMLLYFIDKTNFLFIFIAEYYSYFIYNFLTNLINFLNKNLLILIFIILIMDLRFDIGILIKF